VSLGDRRAAAGLAADPPHSTEPVLAAGGFQNLAPNIALLPPPTEAPIGP